MSFENVLLVSGLLLLLSVLASRLSGRLGVPTLVIFLIIGMLAGSEGIGRIAFNDFQVAQAVGMLALAYILFAGGLETEWRAVRRVVFPALTLSTAGVFLTALAMAAFAMLVLDFTFLEGLLLGSIVSSTDAAAVFAVMRARGTSLQERLKRLLEFESGSNDPMALFLTTAVLMLIDQPDASPLRLVPMFFQQMVVGAIVGYLLARGMVMLINRVRLEYDGLYPVLAASTVLLVFGACALVGGNGFLGVYVAGIVIGNSVFIHRRSVIRFHDGLAWLMQITMFLALGLLVNPSALLPVAWNGVFIALALVFLARPLAVFLTLAFLRFEVREKAVISWVGLRGSVPIILATFPFTGGVAQAETIFNLVFFVVLASILIQGPSIALVARLFGLDAPLVEPRHYPLEFEETAAMDSSMREFVIPAGSPATRRQIVDLDLPEEALVVLLSRDERFLVPRGGTVIEPGDRLLVLVSPADLDRTMRVLGVEEQGVGDGRSGT